jgi:hypothetical protein
MCVCVSKVCYIIESKLKGIMSPHMVTIYYANFHAFLRCTTMFWGGDIASNSIFKLQEGVM